MCVGNFEVLELDEVRITMPFNVEIITAIPGRSQ